MRPVPASSASAKAGEICAAGIRTLSTQLASWNGRMRGSCSGQRLHCDSRYVASRLMVVDVAHEEDRNRSLPLRRERFVQRTRRLGRNDAVENAVRIDLTGLVIDRDDDLPVTSPP